MQTGMNLGNIMPLKYTSHKGQIFPYMKGWLSGISKFIETECKIEVGGGGYYYLIGTKFLIGMMQKLWEDDGGGGFPW